MASSFRFNTGLNALICGAVAASASCMGVAGYRDPQHPALVNSSFDCHGNAHVLGMDQVNSRWTDSDGNFIKPEQKLEQQGVSMVLGWETDLGTLAFTSAYKDMEAAFFNDNDFTPFVIFHNNNDEFSQDQVSHELQFAGDATDKLSYVAGLYYFRETGRQTISLVAPMLPPAGAPPAAPTLPFLQRINRDIDNDSTAVYGQINYDFTSALHLTLGARYTENSKEIDLGLFRGDQSNPWRTVEESDSLDISESNVLLNLSYDLNDNTMIYAQFADGFRDGGWPVRFPGLYWPPLDMELGPEFVDSIEVGLKSTLADGRLRLNAALFSADAATCRFSSAILTEYTEYFNLVSPPFVA